jgi:hypothetical protein
MYQTIAATTIIVIMFMVISLLQLKSLDVNGSAMRISNLFPPRLEKR